MNFTTTPIPSSEQDELRAMLDKFEAYADSGVLNVPGHDDQVVVEEGSEQDAKCQTGLASNHSFFIISYQTASRKFNQYVVSEELTLK